MMDWLNSNSGAVNAILATILVIITFVYAWLTRLLVLESKELREMTMRPALIVTPEIHENYLHIILFKVKNIGGGVARSIRLHTKRPFTVQGEDPLSNLGLFTHGIPLLGPGQKIESFLASGIELFKEPLDEPLEVIVTYKDATGHKFKETFEIDFRSFRNLRRVGDPPLQVIADSVKNLQKNIGDLSNGMKKMSVLVYSRDDLDAENSAWNLFRKLRGVPPDGRKEIENLIDQEISRLGAKSVNPPQSGEGE